MSIITLTTDYGLKDYFIGALKGKIYTEYPEDKIVDISHNIDTFNVTEASYIINAVYKSFPKGTVHIIGVDSERNNETEHIAMQWNDQYFICADNGILSMLTQKIIPQKIVSINIHDRLPENSTDLDVFKTIACHLAKGGLLNVIGKEKQSLKQITQLQPIVSKDLNSIKGNIIYIDHFGNVVVNITKKLFNEIGKARPFEIKLSPKPIKTIHANYSAIAASNKYPIKNYEGINIAVFNENDFLEIGIFRSNPASVGSATSLLGLDFRDVITINFL